MDSQLLLQQNDYSPDLDSEGSPEEFQVGKEWGVIMYQVLMDLGMTAQLARFHLKIWQKTKPGKLKYITDPEMAEAYDGFSASGTRKNYISVLRKKLKAWNSGEYESGRRHYSFISVQDNDFNAKTKRYNPTAYEFSKDFNNLIGLIVRKTRLHRFYRDNWERAARETIAAVLKQNDNLEFGFYRERKQKRPRSLDAIVGTLFLNFRRTTRQLAAVLEVIGIPEVEQKIMAECKAAIRSGIEPAPMSLANYHPQLISKDGPQPKPGEIDFRPLKHAEIDPQTFIAKVMDYVQERENAKFSSEPIYTRPVFEKDSSIVGRAADNVGRDRGEAFPELGHFQPVDSRAADESGSEIPVKPIVDSPRKRFLDRYKTRE